MCTFGVETCMHIRMMLLEPFFAFLGRAAVFAVLGWGISLWELDGRRCCKRSGEERRGTSGGSVQTASVSSEYGGLAEVESVYHRSRQRCELEALVDRRLGCLLRPWWR